MCFLDVNLFGRSAAAPFFFYLGGGMIFEMFSVVDCCRQEVRHPSLPPDAEWSCHPPICCPPGSICPRCLDRALVFLCVKIPHYKLRVDRDETANKEHRSDALKPSQYHLKCHLRMWWRPRRHLRSTLSAQCGQRTQAYQLGFRRRSPAGDRTLASQL